MADMNANVQGIKRASMEMAIILQDLKELKEEEERRKALTGILLVDDWR